jgi:hypothetical protein
MLKKEHKKKWKEVTELLAREQNFQKFREHLHSVDPPCTLALSFFREWVGGHTHHIFAYSYTY